MDILWLCNVVTPNIAEKIGINATTSGGWIHGAMTALSDQRNIRLHVCFPQNQSREILEGEVDGVSFFGFPTSTKQSHIYDPAAERYFAEILARVNPDIVHIWGVEFPHSLAMTRAFAKPARTIVQVQGLCGYIAKHYRAYLPEKACSAWTIRDFLRHDRIVDQQEKFRLRGIMEAQTLRNAGVVIGRTAWDRACVRQLAPQAVYRACNETLRGEFYKNAGAWSVDSCERHSIFVSQASYPIKGFHMVLDAMGEILRRYPDAKLYVPGRDPFTVPFYRVNGYQHWLKEQIMKLGLRDRVFFLGDLDARAMCQRFLRSHVFVSASSIENSPNSVGEAMLLGVPTVASYVGGTMDLLQDGEEGFLYPADASYILADRVCQFFADDALAAQMGSRAVKHALSTHHPQRNLTCLMNIYKEMHDE